MEDSGTELLDQLEDIPISQIVLIQAYVRGSLVRKWMREIRDCYTGIVAELEENPRVRVEWDSDRIGRPKVVKYSKQQLQKLVDDQIAQQQINVLPCIDQLDTDRLSVRSDETFTQSTHSLIGLDTVKSFTTQELSKIDDIRRHEPFHKSNIPDNGGLESVHSSVSCDEDNAVSFVNRPSQNAKNVVVVESQFTTTETQTSFIEIPARKGQISADTGTLFHDKKDQYTNISTHHRFSSHSNTDDCQADVKITDEHTYIQPDNGGHTEPPWNAPTSDSDRTSPKSDVEAGTRGIEHDTYSAVKDESTEHDTDMDRARCEITHSHSDKISYVAHAETESQYSNGEKDKLSDNSARSKGSRQKVKPIAVRSASPIDCKNDKRITNAVVTKEKPTLMSHDSTTLTNVTSVWDSLNSVRDSFRNGNEADIPAELPQDPEKLKEFRKDIAMELLWIQQAINSRKNYLQLRSEL